MSRGALRTRAPKKRRRSNLDGPDEAARLSCSVGDADNFRFWHQPTLRPWAKPPNKKSGQSGRGRRPFALILLTTSDQVFR